MAVDRNMEDRIESANADEMEDLIEAAEEASDVARLLSIVSTCALRHSQTGGDDDWDAPAEASLDSFYRVVRSRSGAEICQAGTRATLFESLREWREEEAIVEVALGCIAALGIGREERLDETVGGIDAELIVDVMRTYEHESPIQEQACLAIEGLAGLSGVLKARLRAIEGIEEELRGCFAGGRITNERNKKYAAQAAAALGLQF